MLETLEKGSLIPRKAFTEPKTLTMLWAEKAEASHNIGDALAAAPLSLDPHLPRIFATPYACLSCTGKTPVGLILPSFADFILTSTL